ncbi:fumarylacetoacetate hydrolase family protein [Alloacidobacterium dinghuense]|uniref:Fumarylacetoacetate hydrolase family protein n=1 Tax=Alloacidobacterium dinghuense TaxID=2763107 RepID=A0A7G8BEL4_9BACT|nr:fumarylacetoacetate hydrolase family protein [Alloacidobacterium dinghuense]QNI30984.1 fumarylacetoacetate hydrolase family protein [Alloacidobacterium dinghuense]
MKLYRTKNAIFLFSDGNFYRLKENSLDALLAQDKLYDHCVAAISNAQPSSEFSEAEILPPIENQEVWASGVTYFRSRTARMEESKDAGGGDFYDRVYAAERPELFFKATGRRVVGHGDKVRIRSDAKWSVPEPELTLVLSSSGRIIGYTIGNDMSSRDIEGENPLYLPQAKVYDGSCALGPCILLRPDPLTRDTRIELKILRNGATAFAGKTALTELKREPQLLADYLFRDNSFPCGSFLMTGTGIVPPDAFTLQSGDQIDISIEHIGTLSNTVA